MTIHWPNSAHSSGGVIIIGLPASEFAAFKAKICGGCRVTYLTIYYYSVMYTAIRLSFFISTTNPPNPTSRHLTFDLNFTYLSLLLGGYLVKLTLRHQSSSLTILLCKLHHIFNHCYRHTLSGKWSGFSGFWAKMQYPNLTIKLTRQFQANLHASRRVFPFIHWYKNRFNVIKSS